MPVDTIQIRDRGFIQQIEQERQARGEAVLSKTLQELGSERLVELQTGQYLPPPPNRTTVNTATRPAKQHS